MSKKKRMSEKHKKFVEEYLISWNATAAYQATYPRATYESARRLGSNLLTNIDIQAVISARLKLVAMSADEVLARLTAEARSNIANMVEPYDVPILDKEGNHLGDRQSFRLKPEAFERYGYLIKSISPTRTGDFKFELHDAQKAKELIGRHRNMFKDTNLNIDLSKLTDAQLERIANGEDPLKVLTDV